MTFTPRSRIALGLAVALLAAGTVVTVDRATDADTYPVTASFPRAIGLFPRSTVRVLGVEVGRVASVTPAGDRVRVVLNIREGVRIPADARAIIVPISLISDRYVQLEPAWEGGPALDAGDEIPLERGIVPAELDDLLATLKGFLEAIEPGTVDEPGALGKLVVNASEALDGQGQELGVTVDSLATLLDVLGRNREHLGDVIDQLEDVIGTLAARDAAVAATNRGLASVFTAVLEERDALRSGIGNITTLLDELGGLVERHRGDLETDLQTLTDTTNILIEHRERVLRNILWLPVLAEGARRAFDDTHDRFPVRDNQQVREP